MFGLASYPPLMSTSLISLFKRLYKYKLLCMYLSQVRKILASPLSDVNVGWTRQYVWYVLHSKSMMVAMAVTLISPWMEHFGVYMSMIL